MGPTTITIGNERATITDEGTSFEWFDSIQNQWKAYRPEHFEPSVELRHCVQILIDAANRRTDEPA